MRYIFSNDNDILFLVKMEPDDTDGDNDNESCDCSCDCSDDDYPDIVTSGCTKKYTGICMSPSFKWDLIKSVLLFIIAVKVAKECNGLSIPLKTLRF